MKLIIILAVFVLLLIFTPYLALILISLNPLQQIIFFLVAIILSILGAIFFTKE
jgi:hypothetical protein